MGSKKGVIKSKAAAQDGIATQNSGTILEDDGTTYYSFDDQTLGTLDVGSVVTFDIFAKTNGDIIAIDIEASS